MTAHPKEQAEGFFFLSAVLLAAEASSQMNWAEGIFRWLQLKQSDLKIRPKCQMSTCIQNKEITRMTNF